VIQLGRWRKQSQKEEMKLRKGDPKNKKTALAAFWACPYQYSLIFPLY
jgi:hypothetical protein